MVNLTFQEKDQDQGRALLMKLFPGSAEFLAKASIEAGSSVVVDDEVKGVPFRVRIAVLAGGT